MIYLLFVASVNSLLSGNPFDDINLNNIAQDYINIFNTSRSLTLVSNKYLHTLYLHTFNRIITYYQMCISYVLVLGVIYVYFYYVA